MDLLHVFYLLGAGLTGSRYYCSVVWPSRYGGSLKEELSAILMFGLLWLGGILIATVLVNLLFGIELIADFSAWQPFQSSWFGWMSGIQLGVVYLAISLLIYFGAMHDEAFPIFNPLMDLAIICVFYAVFCPTLFTLMWLADQALIRFF
jgi:hypothetical protein